MTPTTFENAFSILQNVVYENRDQFHNIEGFLEHSYMTAKIAEKIAEELRLDSNESAIAGMFHDIGKCLTADKKTGTFHEIVGARYITEKGLEWGITDSQEQCYRIAQAVRSHFIVYEQFTIAKEDKSSHYRWLPGLEDTNPELLLPNSWNELVVTYADLRNAGMVIISFEERLAKIKEKDRKNGSPRIKAIEKAKPRLLKIKEDLETALQEGKADLTKYPLL